MSVYALIAIRPEPGLSATLARAERMGVQVTGWPLFAVRPLPWDVPDAADYDGLLLGSANAVRHSGEGLRALAGLPAFCVGEETAKAARDGGLTVAEAGRGNLQDLLDKMAGKPLRLLRLTGQMHAPLTPPADITVTARLVYTVDTLPVPAALARQLREGAVVLLHSGVAAAHFASECDRLDLARARIGLAALAPRVAENAGTGWACVEAAEVPDDAALLAAAARMCKGWT